MCIRDSPSNSLTIFGYILFQILYVLALNALAEDVRDIKRRIVRAMLPKKFIEKQFDETVSFFLTNSFKDGISSRFQNANKYKLRTRTQANNCTPLTAES